jgi:CBS domain containing-hemolysin-like protein
MPGKFVIAIAVVALLAVTGGAGAYYYTANTSHGTVSFSIADPPVVFSAVQLNITAVSIHNASGANYTKSFSSAVQAVFLAGGGSNTSTFLGSLGIPASHYQTITFTIASANVTYSGNNYPLSITNHTVRIVGQFTVVSGHTLSLTIIFDSTVSIHGSASSGFTLTPVVSRVVSSGP